MKHGHKVLAGVLLLCGILFPNPSVQASDAWSKLGRGLGNVITGGLEVIHQPVLMSREERWPIAILGGLPKGVVFAVGRIAVGLYETVTFPLPLPAGYKPIMKPEFIIPEMS